MQELEVLTYFYKEIQDTMKPVILRSAGLQRTSKCNWKCLLVSSGRFLRRNVGHPYVSEGLEEALLICQVYFSEAF